VGICAVIRRVELPFGGVEAHTVFSAYVHAVANADGTVEALESDGPAPVLAVQWHPELDTGPAASAPFAWLAERAEAARCS
jgi:gamma-glutamyl-gamma-aminobutyrate hydrolase PuuD